MFFFFLKCLNLLKNKKVMSILVLRKILFIIFDNKESWNYQILTTGQLPEGWWFMQMFLFPHQTINTISHSLKMLCFIVFLLSEHVFVFFLLFPKDFFGTFCRIEKVQGAKISRNGEKKRKRIVSLKEFDLNCCLHLFHILSFTRK